MFLPVVMQDRFLVQTVQETVEFLHAVLGRGCARRFATTSLVSSRPGRQLEVPQIRSSPGCSRSEEGIFVRI